MNPDEFEQLIGNLIFPTGRDIGKDPYEAVFGATPITPLPERKEIPFGFNPRTTTTQIEVIK